MQYPMQRASIFFGVFAASLFFIFASAKNNATAPVLTATYNDSFAKENTVTEVDFTSRLYHDMHLENAGLKAEVFTAAVKGMYKLVSEGKVKQSDVITIADFSQPSSRKRLYVVDIRNKKNLFNTYVAHGRNSGTLWAKSFSNQNSSLKSSPGFYTTAETYYGGHGYSLRLDGLEKNINDNARARAIVMHGAPYTNSAAVASMGFLGRSWGCPAVPDELTTPIINTIKGGTCLFIYTSDDSYQQNSTVLN